MPLIEPVAAASVLMSTWSCVAPIAVMAFTVTPPENDTPRRCGKPGPGSKKRPGSARPLIVITVLALFPTTRGVTDNGLAGGGAMYFVARTVHTSVALAYSWNDHIVMSSFGSTTVCE